MTHKTLHLKNNNYGRLLASCNLIIIIIKYTILSLVPPPFDLHERLKDIEGSENNYNYSSTLKVHEYNSHYTK